MTIKTLDMNDLSQVAGGARSVAGGLYNSSTWQLMQLQQTLAAQAAAQQNQTNPMMLAMVAALAMRRA